MATAPNGWQNPKTNWASADVPTATDFNRLEGNSNAIETGSRTLDPAQAPTSNTGSLRQILDWFANRIQAITGKPNWWDAPATTLEAAATRAYVDARLPAGVIVMWSGSIASIPAGWALCDGTQGTPDLRDRFIVGAGSATYPVGATGGEATHVLTVNELPAHNHSASTGSAGAHSHGGATGGAGGHGHTVAGRESTGSFAVAALAGTAGNNVNIPTSSVGDHIHGISSDGSHIHSVTVNNTGGGAAHENRPPYYALAFIMKL